MKITVHTKNPEALFKAINLKIANDQLKTWEIKRNAQNAIVYNHSPDQWSDRVILFPVRDENGLAIEAIYWEGRLNPDLPTEGYILGRFVEILMVHFRSYFDKLELQ